MLLKFTHSLYTSRRLHFVLLLLVSVVFCKAQTTITQWNFNSTFTIPANGNAPAPSIGVGLGTVTLVGGITADDAAGVNADPGNPNRGLNTSDYPSQGIDPKTGGIQIQVNTAGYNSVHLKYYTQHSGTAAKKVIIQYFNGSVWQDVSSYLVTNAGSFLPQMDIDLSSYAAINNNAAARLRLVTDFSNGSMYEPVNSANYNAGTGTIRYDLITITGNTLTCVGPATQQATGFRLLKTDASSAQLTLNRGDGGGCLVVCSQSGIPSVPVNNTIYTANPSFGNGATVGNGFAVYNTQVNNPAIQYFNITNLTAGTKYYLAAYEYSNSGNCYLLNPALVDSFYCNSTVLYPGDVQFVGYDNNDSAGGRDFYVLTNLATLKKGTTFQIVNSRYEAGAAADTRTDRWYAGGDAIHQNLQRITITYTDNSLAAGSIISFNHVAQNPGNIKINGNVTTALTISDNLAIGNLLSGTGAEQLYITQGKFTSFGSTAANNQYFVLNGHVLHAFSYTNPWVDFDQSCDSNNIRQSRVPPDISGMKLFFNTDGFAYYKPDSTHSGTQGQLITDINDPPKWAIGGGNNSNQIDPAVLSSTFSPNRLAAAGTWTGAFNNNWFDSRNWEGSAVPDSTTDVIIPPGKFPFINAIAQFADLYNRVASTQALTIVGTLTLDGPASDKLIVYDSLLVDTTGRFSASFGIDTFIVRGNLQRRDGANLGAFMNSFLSLEGNRLLRPIDIRLITSTIYNVRSLGINNLPGVRLLSGGIETVQQLGLTNGVLSVTNDSAVYFLNQNCSIMSPVNMFGEINRGWEKSFIDGRVNIRTNAAIPYTAPLGNAAKNIFAPLVFEPDNTDDRSYTASYTPATSPSAPPSNIATPPLDHVSELEHWTLSNIFNPNTPAKITLYYTPYSRVGAVGNTTQALRDSLRVAQYWDSISGGTRKWRFPGAGSHTVTGDSAYGKISYNSYATDFEPNSRFFTIGTISPFNTLPVQLLTWKATPQSKRVQLNWQVADETDITYYTIEKSIDGLKYNNLQTVYKWSLGNPYTCYDDTPADGWNYYRLKATGIDGKTFYSSIQKIRYTSAIPWAVYPNPATDVLWLQLPAAGIVTLYTVDGKILLQQKLPALLNKLNIKAFVKGMYVLEYFDGRKRWSEKIRLQ